MTALGTDITIFEVSEIKTSFSFVRLGSISIANHAHKNLVMDSQYARKEELKTTFDSRLPLILAAESHFDALIAFGLTENESLSVINNLCSSCVINTNDEENEGYPLKRLKIGEHTCGLPDLNDEIKSRLDQLCYLSGEYEPIKYNPTIRPPLNKETSIKFVVDSPKFLKRNITVLHEDDNFVIVNKPFDVRIDIPTSRAHNFLSEITIADWWYKWALNRIKELGLEIPVVTDPNAPAQHNVRRGEGVVIDTRVRFCHQLDFATSGIICLAKNRNGANIAQKAFEGRKTEKWYYAILRGIPNAFKQNPDEPIEVSEGIGDLSDDGFRMTVHKSRGHKFRDAQTLIYLRSCIPSVYQQVIPDSQYVNDESITGKQDAFVKMDLKTGRRHQLRLHTDFIGHSIRGDSSYGSVGGVCSEPPTDPTFEFNKDAYRMFLHAASLKIPKLNGMKDDIYVCCEPDW